jgi:hypothetical protein
MANFVRLKFIKAEKFLFIKKFVEKILRKQLKKIIYSHH